MKRNTVCKRILAAVISMCLMFGTMVVPTVSQAYAAQEKEKTREVYLSNLDWQSATHADVTQSYKVQKDQTFSFGNNIGGQQTKELKLLVNDVETSFEKGISTNATSRIEWDITGQGYTKLTGYIGVDRNQLSSWNGSKDGAKEGLVKKVTIYADDTVIWESRENFNPTEDAQKVEAVIPEGSKKLIFYADSGPDGQEGQSEKASWGDEVDFADAKLTQTLPEAENLALNKTVTAKNTDGTEVNVNTNNGPDLSKAVDGISQSPYQGVVNYAEFGDEADLTEPKPSYLQVDLGGVYLIDHVNMWRYYNDTRQYQDTVICLAKNSDFSDAVVIYNADTENKQGFGPGTDADYTETSEGKEFSVPENTEARYIRVYCNGAQIGTFRGKTNHIVELQVWGWDFGPKPYEQDAFQNAESYLTSFDEICPDYQLDEDFSSQSDREKAAKGQVTHPDVIEIPEQARAQFGGHKYWMAYTPNGGVGNSYNENPCVAVSEDGQNWSLPAEEVPNPLVMRRDKPVGNNNIHNCDTNIFYDEKNERLIVYWEWTNDANSSAFPRGSAIQYLVSYNGTDWGVPVENASEEVKNSEKEIKTFHGVDLIISAGDDDVYGNAVVSPDARYSDLSPTVTYDSDRDIYLMWANDAGDFGYNNKNCKVWMRWSNDPLTGWSDKIYTNNFLGKDEQNQQLVPWHQDIQFIPELHEFWALAQAWPQPGSTDNTSLRFTKSKDGINWEPVSTKMLLKPSTDGWDNFQIYRSTFKIDFDPDHPGDLNYAKFRIWYGALGKVPPTGLTGQDWHIGYTENDYVEVMKSQSQNEYYEVPEMVDAQFLSLMCADKELQPGETTTVVPVFTPEEASGQLVKFTSQNPDIATVDPFGKVTGIKKGIATIEATSEVWNKTATIRIYVDGAKPEMRIEVNNENPMLIVPMYGSKPSKLSNPSDWDFQKMDWGDTIEGRFQAIPEDLRDNVIFEIHPGGAVGLPSNGGIAKTKEFFEDKLKKCQELGIKTMLVVATAGQVPQYTGTYDMANQEEWLREMFEKYDCLVGLMSTENYWTNYQKVADESLLYAKICADYGGYFVWSEQQTGVLENIFDNSNFQQMVNTYSDHFIMTFKNTPATTGQNAGSNSVIQGAWLMDQMAQWGGLMDTWKWWEKKEWKLFEPSSLPGGANGGEESRCTATEPEALLMSEMMNVYLNGGCVYNFEIPAYVYGSNDKASPAFTHSVAQFMRYAINNPAPSKEQIVDQTKVVFHNTEGKRFSSINSSFYKGLNCEDQTQPTYTTGRYGLIPVVQEMVPESEIKALLPEAEIITKDSECLQSQEEKISYFNEKYPEQYTGDAFGMEQNGKFYVYNSWENKNIVQRATYKNEDGSTIQFEIEPHTNIIYDPQTKNIYLNNYRVDKDAIWEGYTASTKRWNTDTNSLLEQYMDEYTKNPMDDTLRTTKIILTNVEVEPVVSVNEENSLAQTGTTDAPQYLTPTVTYDAQNKTATIMLQCNGYMDITLGEKASSPDKTALQKLYDENKDKEQGSYTVESYEAFKEALKGAKEVLEDETATQDNVDAAIKALQLAIDGLTEAPVPSVNKTVLQDLVKKAQSYVDDGTVETMIETAKKIYLDTLEKAKAVLKDDKATKEEVLDIQTKLSVCITTVKMQAGDKNALGMLLESAGYYTDEVLQNYFEEGQEAFKTAREEAQAVYEDGDAFEADIQSAYEKLFDAMTALRMKPNKDALKLLIDMAGALNANDYTAESFQVLTSVLAKAVDVYNDELAREADVKNAEKLLQNALEGLVKASGETPSKENPPYEKPTEENPDDETTSNSPSKGSGNPPSTGSSATSTVAAGVLLVLSLGGIIFTKCRRREK